MKLYQNYGSVNHVFLQILSERVGRCDGLEFIWETVPQTTSFKYDRSLPQGTMCLFKMKVLSSLLSTILRRAFSVPRYPYLSGTMKVYFGSR